VRRIKEKRAGGGANPLMHGLIRYIPLDKNARKRNQRIIYADWWGENKKGRH
jgi:hypothetical protein